MSIRPPDTLPAKSRYVCDFILHDCVLSSIASMCGPVLRLVEVKFRTGHHDVAQSPRDLKAMGPPPAAFKSDLRFLMQVIVFKTC